MPHRLEVVVAFQDSLQTRLDVWADRFGPQFVLGLSGGGDSMALALGCATWVKSGKGQVHCICVDHGLRVGSGEEADQTVEWAKALGLTAQKVTVNLQVGLKRVQERARQARHIALLAGAKTAGARLILLAHTSNDQHETVALRLASKTGLEGLAGMNMLAPSPFYESDWPCLLGRPLLDFPRCELRNYLVQAGQSWHDDPSNQNLAFARIRARARLDQLKNGGANVGALSIIAAHATILRHTLDADGRHLLASSDLKIDHNQLSLSVSSLRQAGDQLCERVLGWLAFCVGGPSRLPQMAKTTRLRHSIMEPRFRGATLAGAKFQVRGDRLIVALAPPRNGQKTTIAANNRVIQLRLAAVSANIDQFVTHLG